MRHFTLIRFSVLCALIGLGSSALLPETSHARRGHYKRRGNVGCSSNIPVSQRGRLEDAGVKLGNQRAGLVDAKIATYVIALKNKCGHATLQSGYRDCGTNFRVGGMQRSRHLAGRAADTSSGCGHSGSQSVCQSQGLKYINEGPSRFPHCQMR